jgi:hypothetical protein
MVGEYSLADVFLKLRPGPDEMQMQEVRYLVSGQVHLKVLPFLF